MGSTRWMDLILLLLCGLAYFTVTGLLSVDGARSLIMLAICVMSLGGLLLRPAGPPLTKRTRIPTYVLPLPNMRKPKPRLRHSRVHLRRRATRRNPVLLIVFEMVPWAEEETKSAMKYRWISDSHATYGRHLDTFCMGFDPTLPLALMKGDFVDTTRVKDRFQTLIKDFVTGTQSSAPRNVQAFVAATYLQGDNDDAFVYREVYWGAQERGDIIIPIVIDTGASISMSGVKLDF